MIMMLSSLLYVYYVILVLKKRKKKLPIKASCCQNSRTIIISRDLEPVWKKIRFASIDRIALQSSFSIQNLFKFFTLIFFVKSFSRKFT